MTSPRSSSAKPGSDTENPLAVMLSVLVIIGGGCWLAYRYLTKNTDLLATIDRPTVIALAASTITTIVAAIILWQSTHPGEPSPTHPEKWAMTLPVPAAAAGTAAGAFTATLLVTGLWLHIPHLPAMGLSAAAAVAAAGCLIDRCRLIDARLQLRSTLIQALYSPLGHKEPSARIAVAQYYSGVPIPHTVTVRASRPMTALTPRDESSLQVEDPAKPAGRLDPATTIRRALTKHCDAHYRVTADPSDLVYTATQFVPEQIDAELADLTRKARDVFDTTATVTGSLANGFTISNVSAKKLTGEFRKRVAEQNMTELVGGAWRVKFDLPSSQVIFKPKPTLDRLYYPKPIPAVRSISEAIGQYRHTRFAYGVDLDLGIQEWDPLDSPHTLVSGKTGAGKTVFLRTLIMMAALSGWAVVLVDFKGGSYSDFVGWPNVHIISSDPFESIATIHRMYKLMDERNARARWDQSQWEKNLPYLVIVDEASQFKVVLERMWANLKPAKNAPKECPTITELGEMARLARSSRVHLVLGMQRPGHELIDTDARDNFGNRVSVGPISRIAAEMIFEDSYTGRNVPRIKGRGMSTGTHQDPRETQYYFTPPADSTDPTEAAVINALRPPVTLIPRYVPELPKSIAGATWDDIADAPWFPLSQRPDLDPTMFHRKVTDFGGDSQLGFDLAEIISTADTADMLKLTVAAKDLQPNDLVSFGDGNTGEVDGIDIADTGTVTVMWQDDHDSLLKISTLDPSSVLSVSRNSS
ncbi:FtsK/SpoIIIE domain-containing protein [Mycobacteroides abscessus]|uniref:FtsK/SpoIIIE domain-containing protein n=1 Tax=Mycobacteroides abscessus TaxID=36809 RepID=UPI001F24E57B|nr:FtsK/SpoIIIE domain-containing protein [Mycobacteroides abscessus]